jgi:hypothetical protein
VDYSNPSDERKIAQLLLPVWGPLADRVERVTAHVELLRVLDEVCHLMLVTANDNAVTPDAWRGFVGQFPDEQDETRTCSDRISP